MNLDSRTLAETYVKLTLALDLHIEGYVDSYFGPPKWRTAAQTAGKRPLPELAREARALGDALAQDQELSPQRRDFLTRQVRAMQTTIALQQGETMPLAQEVEALYDVTPHRIDEREFEEIHRALDELLPAGGALRERMIARRDLLKVPFDSLAALIPALLADLRARTAAKFPLPDNESFEFAAVTGKPWGAYNWYLGNYHSLIEWNTDLPTAINILPAGLAHEGYPGHHTEHALKELHLVNEQGQIEHAVTILNAPECTIGEAVATAALDLVYSRAEQVELFQNTIYPALGLKLDAARELAIDRAADKLSGVRDNAVYLLHEDKESHEAVAAYLEQYALMEPAQAQKAVQFQAFPLYRSYAFTYTLGNQLLNRLFDERGDKEMWFGRMLTEAITPRQVREWIGEGN